jgi:hypothetical protein
MAGTVLFDLDNTLVDRSAAYRRWAEAVAAANGWDEAEVAWLVDADGDGYTARDELFARVRDRYGLADPVDHLVAAYERDYPRCVIPDPTVCEALRELRAAGRRLAIVTNGFALQRVKVRQAGLEDLVDACCVSGELEVWKPDRHLRAGHRRLRRGGCRRAHLDGRRFARARHRRRPRTRSADGVAAPRARLAPRVLRAGPPGGQRRRGRRPDLGRRPRSLTSPDVPRR